MSWFSLRSFVFFGTGSLNAFLGLESFLPGFHEIDYPCSSPSGIPIIWMFGHLMVSSITHMLFSFFCVIFSVFLMNFSRSEILSSTSEIRFYAWSNLLLIFSREVFISCITIFTSNNLFWFFFFFLFLNFFGVCFFFQIVKGFSHLLDLIASFLL